MIARNNAFFDVDRLGSLGVVVLVHVLLATVLIYAMHAPSRRAPQPDLVITLQADTKPPAASMPVPLAMMKRVLISVPQLELPPLPQIQLNAPAPATPVAAVPQATKPAVPEAHVDSVKEIAVADDTAPTLDASATGNPKPVYPRASRALGEQGKVMLDVYVQADGTVGDIHLHQSSGFERLDDAALRAVRQWRFKPARQAGKQIAMWYVQPINFDLHSA